MRKLTQKTWNKIHKDFKLIKDNKKYAMVDNSTLEPVEIDNKNGEYYVKIIFAISELYYEYVIGLYNPINDKDTNFKRMIKDSIYYEEEYKYFIEHNLYKIIDIQFY